jgi:hypothetical protein
MLTTHPLLVPRLKKSRSYTSCHPDAPLWSITGPLYIRFYVYESHGIFAIDLLKSRRNKCNHDYKLLKFNVSQNAECSHYFPYYWKTTEMQLPKLKTPTK